MPVRAGSKSIPNKNIKSFCEKPLLFWVLRELQNCDSIHEIILATDSNEIKQISLDFNFSKLSVYDRKPENAMDNSTTESVLLEYLDFQKLNEDDLIFLVQVTSPFTKSADFEAAYKLLTNSNSDSLLSCTIFKRFLWDKKCNPKNYDIYNRPRRQDIDGDFIENGAFYISFVKNILKSKNRISGKISIYEMEEYTSFEIDEEYDWIIAENLMKKFNLN
mgnify:CR=1 FL=1